MKSFEVPNLSAEEFIKKVTEAVSGRGLGEIATFTKEGTDIVVTLSKLGTSQLRYGVENQASGFKATLKSEKIAFAHKPFKADMESKIASVMQKLGAKLS